MADILAVDNYIQENILHSELWDYSDAIRRKKAVNNAEKSLLTFLSDVFHTPNEIPVDVIAEQALWTLKIDDTIQRSQLGIQTIWVDGTMVTVRQRDLSVAPYVYARYNIPVTRTGKRRKVGHYEHNVAGTYRIGNGYLADAREIRRKVNNK